MFKLQENGEVVGMYHECLVKSEMYHYLSVKHFIKGQVVLEIKLKGLR